MTASHLLQMRGLKPFHVAGDCNGYVGSHLLQMRGLKPSLYHLIKQYCCVASFTDAWIETVNTSTGVLGFSVESFTDAWIETFTVNNRRAYPKSHLLQMRGLKPLFKGAFERVFNVASFTGTTIYNIFCKKITGLKYLFVRK